MSLVPEDNNPHDPDEAQLHIPDEAPLNVDADNSKLPRQAKNYESKTQLVSELSEEAKAKFGIIDISMLPDFASRSSAEVEKTRPTDVDITEESYAWYTTLANGFSAHPAKGVFEDALADPNAQWANALYYNNVPINAGRPTFNNKGRSATMSSERLQMSVRAKLGLGSPVQEPMIGSGFYVTSKPLGEDEIIGLWRDVIANPVRLGRVTHGLMFSNNSVFAARDVYNAWQRNIMSTTVSDLPLDKLADHLTINDLPLICHAVATSIYPNGFPITRAVFYPDTGMPKEEISQLIDIRKALFMNGAIISEEQRAHLVKRVESPTTLKQVKEYREGFKQLAPTVIEIIPTIKIHLHTPSLREYFDSGEKWINEITAAVTSALGKDAEIGERLPYISKLAKASRLRQYAHYIKAIEEDGEIYTVRENVDRTLYSLSESDEISAKIYKAVSDYINSTQVAIVATTSVNEFEDEKSGDKFPRLIPIDALSVFFQLVEQKLLGITSRELADT